MANEPATTVEPRKCLLCPTIFTPQDPRLKTCASCTWRTVSRAARDGH